MSGTFSRRSFIQGSALSAISAAAAFALRSESAWGAQSLEKWIAAPPAGFSPFSAPGKVVKVEKGTDFASLMQTNQLWPKPEVARQMLERVLTELTGAPNIV